MAIFHAVAITNGRLPQHVRLLYCRTSFHHGPSVQITAEQSQHIRRSIMRHPSKDHSEQTSWLLSSQIIPPTALLAPEITLFGIFNYDSNLKNSWTYATLVNKRDQNRKLSGDVAIRDDTVLTSDHLTTTPHKHAGLTSHWDPSQHSVSTAGRRALHSRPPITNG